MATQSSVLAWRIPGTGEPDGLPSMGSHRVGHDWRNLAAAATAAACIFYQYSSEDTTYYIPLMLLSSFNWSILRSFYSSFFFLEKVKGILAFSVYQIISHTHWSTRKHSTILHSISEEFSKGTPLVLTDFRFSYSFCLKLNWSLRETKEYHYSLLTAFVVVVSLNGIFENLMLL